MKQPWLPAAASLTRNRSFDIILWKNAFRKWVKDITSREFAKLIGVSQSTVSRALNGSSLVTEEKAKYIRDKAAEYGFILNSQAQSLKTKRTGTIGILFPVFFEGLSRNLMFTYIYDTVQKKLSDYGYDIMVIYDYQNSVHNVDALERIIKNGKVDGFVNLRPFLSEHEQSLVYSYKVPCVTMFNAHQREERLHQFIIDEYQGAYTAGEYYAAESDRKKVFVSLPMTSENSKLRLEGYKNGLSDRQADLDNCLSCELSTASAYDIIIKNAEYFRNNKTACLVYNDMMAVGVVHALLRLGVRIPEDAKVIGMDDIPLTTWLPPHLSTLRVPTHKMVEEACSCLFRLIDGEEVHQETKLYLPTLIHRDTT